MGKSRGALPVIRKVEYHNISFIKVPSYNLKKVLFRRPYFPKLYILKIFPNVIYKIDEWLNINTKIIAIHLIRFPLECVHLQLFWGKWRELSHSIYEALLLNFHYSSNRANSRCWLDALVLWGAVHCWPIEYRTWSIWLMLLKKKASRVS